MLATVKVLVRFRVERKNWSPLRVCGAGTGPHLADTEGEEERAGAGEGRGGPASSVAAAEAALRPHFVSSSTRRNPPHPTALVLGATLLEWFRRVDKRGEGDARGAEIGGKAGSQDPYGSRGTP